MLFVIIEDYSRDVENTLYKRFENYQRPAGVKILGHYQLIGQHRIVIVCESDSEEALTDITSPWTDLVNLRICPAMNWPEYYERVFLSRSSVKENGPDGTD